MGTKALRHQRPEGRWMNPRKLRNSEKMRSEFRSSRGFTAPGFIPGDFRRPVVIISVIERFSGRGFVGNIFPARICSDPFRVIARIFTCPPAGAAVNCLHNLRGKSSIEVFHITEQRQPGQSGQRWSIG